MSKLVKERTMNNQYHVCVTVIVFPLEISIYNKNYILKKVYKNTKTVLVIKLVVQFKYFSEKKIQ